MANEELKSKAKAARVYMWEVADVLGISEPTLCRWMRYPLTAEQEKRVLDAIAKISGGDRHE